MPSKNLLKRHAQRKREKAALNLAAYRARPDVKSRMDYWTRAMAAEGQINKAHVTVDGVNLAVTNATVSVILPKRS